MMNATLRHFFPAGPRRETPAFLRVEERETPAHIVAALKERAVAKRARKAAARLHAMHSAPSAAERKS